MELILLQKVKNLGDLGDTVKVKSGYGRNFLLPQGKALSATEANRKVFEERKAELVKKANDSLNGAKIRAEKLAGVVIKVRALAAEEGKLYGSVGPRDIADSIAVRPSAEVESSGAASSRAPSRQPLRGLADPSSGRNREGSG